MANMNTIASFLKKERGKYHELLEKVPPLAMSIFVLSVVSMNLLANKELFKTNWVALDCGFAVSWIPFIVMDCVCKAYGGGAAARLSILAIVINLATFLAFKLVTATPGMWGEYYSTGIQQVNDSLNKTIGGSTWIVLGSAFAMAVSSIVNSLVNSAINPLLKKDTYGSFALRSFTSTAVAQFVDNFTFAMVVNIPLFGWNLTQALLCSTCAAGFELLMEVAFSGYGYRISKKWTQKDNAKA